MGRIKLNYPKSSVVHGITGTLNMRRNNPNHPHPFLLDKSRDDQLFALTLNNFLAQYALSYPHFELYFTNAVLYPDIPIQVFINVILSILPKKKHVTELCFFFHCFCSSFCFQYLFFCRLCPSIHSINLCCCKMSSYFLLFQEFATCCSLPILRKLKPALFPHHIH